MVIQLPLRSRASSILSTKATKQDSGESGSRITSTQSSSSSVQSKTKVIVKSAKGDATTKSSSSFAVQNRNLGDPKTLKFIKRIGKGAQAEVFKACR